MSVKTLMVLLSFAIVGRVIGDYNFTSTGNPLVTHISAADPDAHVWEGKVWVFCSKDSNLRRHGLGPNDDWTYAYMDGYQAFSSDDMVHWVDHGEVFHSRNVDWGPKGWMWAPSVAWNGKRGRERKYFLYYPHKDWKGVWRIGVATASTPIGPFVDSGAPIQGMSGIDPHVFMDDNNQAFIYFNSANVAKLNDSLMALAEPPKKIEYGASAIQDEFRFEEGSYMHKRDGVYYYSYSNWRALSTTAYYATGTTPYGPFKWQGALSGRKSGSQDHHSIIPFKGRWYYFFHKDTPWKEKNILQWHGHRRITCYTEMFYHRNQSILQVNPTAYYINAGSSPFTARDGTAYQWDQWFDDGNSGSTTGAIWGTRDDALYNSYRYGRSFGYTLPVTNGRFRVTFKFAETHHNSAGKRSFDVVMEGKRVITHLDVFSLVGKNKARDIVREVWVGDNELDILFSAVADNAMVSALKIELVQPAIE